MNKQEEITQIATQIYAAYITNIGSRQFYWEHSKQRARECIRAAEDIIKQSHKSLQWLPTELGTNYSSGVEFFITKEHDGYWLWNTNNQIRLALFSTEDKAKEYAEHLRTY